MVAVVYLQSVPHNIGGRDPLLQNILSGQVLLANILLAITPKPLQHNLEQDRQDLYNCVKV